MVDEPSGLSLQLEGSYCSGSQESGRRSDASKAEISISFVHGIVCKSLPLSFAPFSWLFGFNAHAKKRCHVFSCAQKFSASIVVELIAFAQLPAMSAAAKPGIVAHQS